MIALREATQSSSWQRDTCVAVTRVAAARLPLGAYTDDILTVTVGPLGMTLK